MFEKRKQPPPVVREVAAKIEALAQPVPIRRPLVELMRQQTVGKEKELSDALAAVERLTRELQSFRREEAWLLVNPEFDAIYDRLMGVSNAQIRTP